MLIESFGENIISKGKNYVLIDENMIIGKCVGMGTDRALILLIMFFNFVKLKIKA